MKKIKEKASRLFAGMLTMTLLISMVSPSVKAEGTENLAQGAKVEASCVNDQGTLEQLVDGTTEGENGIVSKDNVATPQDIILTWDSGCTFNQIDLYSSYAKNQGPTRWDIAVTADGSNWTTIAKDVTADWQYTDATVEKKSTFVAKQENIKSLKLTIQAYANTWRHFYIKDLQMFFNAGAESSRKTVTVSEGCGGAGLYAADDKVTVTAPFDAGQKKAFKSWKIEGLTDEEMKAQGISSSQNPFTFSMPNNAVTLEAEYIDQRVSSQVVKGENGKGYLEVGGQPWLYTFVQNMGKWERMGHQEEFKENSGSKDPDYPTEELPLKFLENMYEKTAHLNYKTISQALMWRDIETEPGVYDFTVIDAYVAWAKKYGMKLDLAWFGSACQSGSRIPNLSSGKNGEGTTVDLGYQYTAPAWYVQDENGKEIATYYELGGAGSVAYNLRVTGENAEYMKQREYYALQALFNHLAETDSDGTVIAIQIENEPNMRDKGWTELTQWMNDLGKAVKESGYVVATRLNFAGTTYSVNANNLPYIDFVGTDPYTTSLSNIKGILSDGEANSSLTYIAENSGNYGNVSSLTTAALTVGGFYGTWALDNWFCDGGGGHFNGPHSLYKNDQKYYTWELGTIPNLTDQATDIMHYNKGLNKMAAIIAAAGRSEMAGFNVDSDYPAASYDGFQKIGGYQIGYQADDASVGIAVSKGRDVYVTSDTAGSVTIKTKLKPIEVTEGTADGAGNWTKGKAKEVTRDGDGNYCFTLASEECICIQMPESEELPNLALGAVAASSSEDSGYPAKNVNDGDEWSGTKSQRDPSYPQYITLTWEDGQTFDIVDLTGTYAKDQNPTNWEIEVSANGTGNWVKAAESGEVQWTTSDGSAERKRILLPEQKDVRGLRIKINKANTKWNAYYVTEIQVFSSGELGTLLEKAKAETGKTDEYTAESLKGLADVIEKAQKVYEDPNASKTEMEKAVQDLNLALNALVKLSVVDKSALENQLKEAEALKEDEYTAESWKAFRESYDKAKKINEDENASQEQVDEAVTALQTVINSLEKKPEEPIVDKSALENQLKEAEALKEDEYTAESWKAFRESYDKAKKINEDENASQEQVDEAVTALQTAIEGLKEAVPPTPEKTLVSIRIAKEPEKSIYSQGEEFDSAGLVIEAVYSDNSVEIITEGFDISGFNAEKTGEQVITISYQGQTATFVVNVVGVGAELTTGIDNGTVKVSLPEEAMPDDLKGNPEAVKLQVEKKEQADALILELFNQIADILNREDSASETAVNMENATVLDIKLVKILQDDAQEEIQPADYVIVSIPKPVGYSNNLRLFHSHDGMLEEINFDLKEGSDLVFRTNKFSNFIVYDAGVADKSGLETVLTKAEALNQDEYTAESWNMFKDAYEKAQAVNADGSASQGRVDEAAAALDAAINSLEKKSITEPTIVDKSSLESKLNAAKELKEDEYTAESWKAFKEAYEKAEAVNADGNASQEQVDEVAAALDAAINSLEKKSITEPTIVDKSALESKLNAAKALKEDEYTAESWKAFKDAYEKAEAVNADGSASQEQVDEAVAALDKALNNLKKKSTETGNAGNSQAGNQTSGGNQNIRNTNQTNTAPKTGDESPIVVLFSITLIAFVTIVVKVYSKVVREKQ